MFNLFFIIAFLVAVNSEPPVDPPAAWHLGSTDTCGYSYHKTLRKNVYVNVDTQPEFSGGNPAYMRFVNKNLQVPLEAFEDGQYPSTARMQFIVDTDGKIIEPVINLKSDTLQMDAYEKELLRLVKTMPRWIPGRCNGKEVAVKVNRPMIVCFRGDE